MSPRHLRHLTGLATLAFIPLTACASSSSGPAALALGASATVEDVTHGSGGKPDTDTTYTITVTGIRKGTAADLTSAGYQLEADEQQATPWYVDVHWQNAGAGEATRGQTLMLELANGDSLSPTTLISLDGTPFATCPRGDTAAAFRPGEAYDSCLLFLVRPGQKVARVRFVSQDAKANITFTDWSPS